MFKILSNNRSFLFDITSGKVKTNTYGPSIFASLENANSLSDSMYFFGGISGDNKPFGSYNLGIFKIPVNGTIRPLFFVTIGSKDEKEDVSQGIKYIIERF